MFTHLIIVICIIVFVYIHFISKLDKTDCAMRLGAFYPPNVKNRHEYYRIITCHFIHIDFIHCFMNCYCIYSLGGFFENLLGTIPYLLLIFVSMITSSLMTLSASEVSSEANHTITLGASGIFYGYLGALIALAVLLGGAFADLLSQFMMVIVLNVLFTLTSPSTSKFGHLGGALGGFIAIVLLRLVGFL
ncbi:MAG: rhomboid family intramembrane serine protease [Bacilli bacterium]|nr:rhomboid family intramembrane serine protease [Bacilli bacterium]